MSQGIVQEIEDYRDVQSHTSNRTTLKPRSLILNSEFFPLFQTAQIIIYLVGYTLQFLNSSIHITSFSFHLFLFLRTRLHKIILFPTLVDFHGLCPWMRKMQNSLFFLLFISFIIQQFFHLKVGRIYTTFLAGVFRFKG